ncbi:MAG: O-methyltransferase [Chloroflexi bacterium]|nr:O-methyltransferase [Chloroflexota bacterium]
MKSDRDWIPTADDLEWIEAGAEPPIEALLAIERAAEPDGVPIVDRASGRVLAALAAGRARIVEVGTAFGYSTLWLALGQPAGGTIVTIDPDRERTDRARQWWRAAGIDDARITVVTAQALDAFAAAEPALAGPFDLAFIDALKPEYPAYLEALVPRLSAGAILVADNVLWSGRVSGTRPSAPGDRDTEALRAFDRSVLRDPRFGAATILPVGDGLLLAGYRG